jgi:hypothetical protein
VTCPDCPAVACIFNVQSNELVPHPLFSVAADAGSKVALLLETRIVRSFTPLRESVAGDAELPDCTFWLPPDMTRTVGGGGFVTVTVTFADAERPAPSITDRLR